MAAGEKRVFDRTYFLTGLGLLTLCFIVLVWTRPDMGMTDDDDYYVPAGIEYAKWLEKTVQNMAKGSFESFGKTEVDLHWSNNHEHPAVAKVVIGACWLILHKYTGLMSQIDAGAMGVVLFAMLLLYLVFRFSWEIFGPRAAIFAVLALMTMPRTFFHMHVPTLDLPTAATVFWVVYAVWRAESSRIWILWAGIIYGIALCTKLNGPFVVFPLLVYWFYRWRQAAVLGSAARLGFKRMFLTGLSMALLAFPVFWILWPWIWFDTINRLVGYFNFHFHHYGIRLLYFGDIYLNPPAPWHAVFVYAVLTMPLVTLVLGLWGAGRGLGQLHVSNLKTFKEGSGSKNDYALLCALNALFAISIVAFPHNPKYGGVKVFQPMFPFFAILAGYGFSLFLERIGEWKAIFDRKTAVILIGAVLLLPGLIGMARTYPYMLSYYNSLAGGPMGATQLGLERQYYDVCYRTMIDHINEKYPNGARVTFEPNLGEYKRTFKWYQGDKILNSKTLIRDLAWADYMILTHERRWEQYQSLVNTYRQYPVLHKEKVWGTPLWTVYDIRELRKAYEAERAEKTRGVQRPGKMTKGK